MQFEITDFRAVANAVTDDARLTMIMGGNMQGKTGILNALGAALTGNPKVYEATQADLSQVLRHGCERASVKVSFDDGFAALQWPGKPNSHPPVPAADNITIGRVDPCAEMDRGKWASFVREMAGTKLPDSGVVITKLASYADAGGIAGRVLDEIEKMVDISWDDALDYALAMRKAARGHWTHATGATWGTAKAQEWMAEGYLASLDLAAAECALEQHSDYLQELKNQSAVDPVELADIGTKIMDLRCDLGRLKDLIGETDNKLGVAMQERSLYADSDPLECPHCAGLIVFASGGIVPATAAKPRKGPEFAALIRLIGDLAEEQARYNSQHDNKQSELSAASKRETELRARTGVDKEAEKKDLYSRIAQHQTEIGAYKQTRRAQQLYQEWLFWDEAHKLLAPSGLRQEATKLSLAGIQAELDEVASFLFPGHVVSFEASEGDIEITFDKMSYKSLTWNGDPNSYKLRTQYLFQILRARQLGKNSPVLLDRVDTLERHHVVGLMQCLISFDVQAVLARTMPDRPKDDKLLMKGVGRSYWLENGTLEHV